MHRSRIQHVNALYFAYGSNLHREQMQGRCPDSRPVSALTLPGFRLVFRGVADITPDIDSSVEGAIYAISARDEQALDRYEGWPSLYRKEYFLCEIDGQIRQVMYYKMNAHDIGTPSEYYFDVIAQGFRDWGLNTHALLRAREHAEEHDRAHTEYPDNLNLFGENI